MSRPIYLLLSGILLWATVSDAFAAELRSKFSTPKSSKALSSAKLNVECSGGWKKTVSLGKKVKGIPGNRGCFFIITAAGLTPSAKVSFNTKKSVVSIRAKLKTNNKNIVVYAVQRK